MMNFPNAQQLHTEVIKFLYFLQTLAPIQLQSLWQFVQFEDKEQRWLPAQLIPIAERTSPAQLEQLMCLTAANKRLDTDGTAETKKQLESLATELSLPPSQLECFGSLFQLFHLQDLFHSFSFVQLCKFFEVIPSDTQRQQLHVIQQLQQLFTQLTPETLETLHQEVQDCPPEVEMQLLTHALHLQPEHFNLYQPIRSLLHMQTHELRSFQDALPKLQPIQMLQLLQLLQCRPYEVVELKKVFYQNQSQSSIVDPPYEFEPRPFIPPQDDGDEDLIGNDQVVQTQRPTIGLQIVDQPPEKAVYKRNVKPNPSVQLIGEHMGVREGELYVVPLLLRCDTFAEEPRYITGNRPMPITFGRVVTFRKLKVMVTSHQQQETLFSFKFELRRKIGEDEYEVLGSVTTNPICMLSHSTQMKPIATTPPTILEVIPSTGPATGGTRVAILGGNFADTPATRVRFDTTDVIPEFRGPGTLVCHTPQHVPGPVLVRVANGPGAWSEGACTYTYAVVNRAAAAAASSAVPSNMFPPATFTFDPTGGANISAPSFHGFNFSMDVSSISVGGGMVDAVDQVGYAPLHYAAALGLVEQARELLARGAHAYTQDVKGNTPIHWAVAFNQFQIAALLLTQGTKYMNAVNICNLTGRTPLHWACAMGHQQLVTLLVEAGGALVNVMDEDGATPLHAAAAVGHAGIVKYLLARGAFLCSEDEVGDTPLHWAIREGHETVVAALLESQSSSHLMSPASLSQPYTYTQSGLFVSSQGITLLPIQAHPNEDGETPLHLAACTASASMVFMLLRHGSPPNLRDANGWTPLHHAAASGFDNVVRVFIDAHTQALAQAGSSGEGGMRGWGSAVDLNALDWEGNSPLHLACQIANQEVVCRLLFAGADPNTRDRQGMTPLQQSRAAGLKVEDFLMQQKQQANKGNNNSSSGSPPKLQQQQESYFQQLQNMLGASANRAPFVRSVMDWLGRTLKGAPADEGGGRGEILPLPDQVAM